jgi:hypothetical protein
MEDWVIAFLLTRYIADRERKKMVEGDFVQGKKREMVNIQVWRRFQSHLSEAHRFHTVANLSRGT